MASSIQENGKEDAPQDDAQNRKQNGFKKRGDGQQTVRTQKERNH